MKLSSTLRSLLAVLFAALLLLASMYSRAQVTTVCGDPTTFIYGLTGNGEILEINTNTAATATLVKNNSYSGNSPSRANGLGYNFLNSKFYYFKRNLSSSPQEFVSFTPGTGTVSLLAASTCTDDVHTGCVSANGAGYYTIDVQGVMHYYDIANNTWTQITTQIVDQNGNDVDAVIRSQSAGDMAIDGWGNIWLVTSSNTNYGLYKFPANLPTTAVASFQVTRIVDPTATTPTGQSFAGIAFNPGGQIYMATKNGNRLYRMENNLSLTFIGTLGTNDVGNDLSSCSFPYRILPVYWKSFEAKVSGNGLVELNWTVIEQNNQAFTVEYSPDGESWKELAYIPSRNGRGGEAAYSFAHLNWASGKQYYRIRQTDPDGTRSYSDIRVINLDATSSEFDIWPNPAHDRIRFTLSSDQRSVFTRAALYDLGGRMMAHVSLRPGENILPIDKLSTGTYILKFFGTDGSSQTNKIIKQ